MHSGEEEKASGQEGSSGDGPEEIEAEDVDSSYEGENLDNVVSDLQELENEESKNAQTSSEDNERAFALQYEASIGEQKLNLDRRPSVLMKQKTEIFSPTFHRKHSQAFKFQSENLMAHQPSLQRSYSHASSQHGRH